MSSSLLSVKLAELTKSPYTGIAAAASTLSAATHAVLRGENVFVIFTEPQAPQISLPPQLTGFFIPVHQTSDGFLEILDLLSLVYPYGVGFALNVTPDFSEIILKSLQKVGSIQEILLIGPSFVCPANMVLLAETLCHLPAIRILTVHNPAPVAPATLDNFIECLSVRACATLQKLCFYPVTDVCQVLISSFNRFCRLNAEVRRERASRAELEVRLSSGLQEFRESLEQLERSVSMHSNTIEEIKSTSAALSMQDGELMQHFTTVCETLESSIAAVNSDMEKVAAEIKILSDTPAPRTSVTPPAPIEPPQPVTKPSEPSKSKAPALRHDSQWKVTTLLHSLKDVNCLVASDPECAVTVFLTDNGLYRHVGPISKRKPAKIGPPLASAAVATVAPRTKGGNVVLSSSLAFAGDAAYCLVGPDLHRCEVNANWVKIASMPTVPVGASIAVSGDTVFVYGGYVDAAAVCTSSVFSYSLSKDVWTSHRVGEMPSARCCCQARAIGGALVIAGGLSIDHHIRNNLSDVWRFDPSTTLWEKLKVTCSMGSALFVYGDEGFVVDKNGAIFTLSGVQKVHNVQNKPIVSGDCSVTGVVVFFNKRPLLLVIGGGSVRSSML